MTVLKPGMVTYAIITSPELIASFRKSHSQLFEEADGNVATLGKCSREWHRRWNAHAWSEED
jgi:hypothetical protein